MKRLTRTSKGIQEALDNLEGLITVDPDKDYGDCYVDVNFQLAVLTSGLFDSTIHSGHDLWKEKVQYTNRIMSLKADKKITPSTVTVIKPEFDREFSMPKLNIPKFKGVLETWHGFWNRYKAAVHDNERLKESVKMVLLIDLVADPALADYLVAANDGKEGRYQEVIKYLQTRFDQPRELHQLHCRKLADLQPIKGTAAELSQVADTVFSAVEGIRRSGQESVDYLATSLAVSVLPKQPRQEWETKTEEEPLVPSIDSWIAFIRKKALHAGKGTSSVPNASARPPKDYKKEKVTHNHTQGKVHMATSQPTPEADSPPSKSRNPSKRPAVNNCKVQCYVHKFTMFFCVVHFRT